MALNSFTSGVNTSFSTELNGNFRGNRILEIYTDAGLDLNNTTASTTESSTIELTEVASSSLGDADYLVIEALFYQHSKGNGTHANTISYQIETKEIGGSYSDSLSTQNIFQNGGTDVIRSTVHPVWRHTLTAGEKTNGIQVRITTNGTVPATSGTAILTNLQVIERTEIA